MGGEAARQQLAVPPIPGGFAYLLDWFNELHRRRRVGPHGPLPFVWSDIDAWARRTHRDPVPWELGVIDRLDDAYFAAQHTDDTPPADAPRDQPAWPESKQGAA